MVRRVKDSEAVLSDGHGALTTRRELFRCTLSLRDVPGCMNPSGTIVTGIHLLRCKNDKAQGEHMISGLPPISDLRRAALAAGQSMKV
jgi:hypothetical protein